MKRFLTFVLCCFGMLNGFAYQGVMQIELCYSVNAPYEDPEILDDENAPRVPAHRLVVTILNNVVYFNAFNKNGCIELIDPTTEDVVFRSRLAGTDTSCVLLGNLTGDYIIKFVFDEYTYCGYLTF